VHFSFLQEYMASKLGWPVGTYTHVSNDFHAYGAVLDKYRGLAIHAPDPFRTISRCWYVQGRVASYPLMKDPNIWDSELIRFMLDPLQTFQESFFEFVAKPMAEAHYYWRNKEDPRRFERARKALDYCAASDWRLAGLQWLDCREQKAQT